jgi:hypothetical protein
LAAVTDPCLASNLSFVEAVEVAEQTLAGPGLDPGIAARPPAEAGMATVLENMVLVMAEAVAEGRMGLTTVGADCLLERAVGSVIEARTVANTVVQPVQGHSDLGERLPLEAGCTVMDPELL